MAIDASRDETPSRFSWLPRPLRPPPGMTIRQERVFLLLGITILYAGYDLSIYGFAMPQIQTSLHIPENQVGLTVSYFRLAAIAALLICACADVVGRRRLLLMTIVGQTVCTFATAFAGDYSQFVWLQVATRVFGYSEEMLCIVVLAEEISANSRGWANGAFSAFYFSGTALASIVFAMVSYLPYGWRAIYVLGAVPLLLIAYSRRRLPETKRFEVQKEEITQLASNTAAVFGLLRRLALEQPVRMLIIFGTVSAFGFAVAPASALGFKYMQQSLGFSPAETSKLFLASAALAIWLSIMAGKRSDNIGRKPVIVAALLVCGIGFALFFSGIKGWFIAPTWLLAFTGYFCADALVTGYALEVVPTAYRATVSGARFMVETLMGALSLALEGRLYDLLGGHGPAVMIALAAMPLALLGLMFLPEPAGKPLEELSRHTLPDRK